MAHDNCIDTLSGASLSPSVCPSWRMSLTWRGWLRDGKRLIIGEVLRTVTIVRTWNRRARARRQLAMFDAHILADIGLTREEAQREAQKPFWQD